MDGEVGHRRAEKAGSDHGSEGCERCPSIHPDDVTVYEEGGPRHEVHREL